MLTSSSTKKMQPTKYISPAPTPAKYNSVDEATVRGRIVYLQSTSGYDNTQIEALQHEYEPEAIHDIVDNKWYEVVAEDGSLRSPEYRDNAVLTRTWDFVANSRAWLTSTSYRGHLERYRALSNGPSETPTGVATDCRV
jgi:hypothetical protein